MNILSAFPYLTLTQSWTSIMCHHCQARDTAFFMIVKHGCCTSPTTLYEINVLYHTRTASSMGFKSEKKLKLTQTHTFKHSQKKMIMFQICIMIEPYHLCDIHHYNHNAISLFSKHSIVEAQTRMSGITFAVLQITGSESQIPRLEKPFKYTSQVCTHILFYRFCLKCY